MNEIESTQHHGEISSKMTLFDGLPNCPGIILEDRDGLIYVAVIDDAEGIIVRYDGDTWETWQQGSVAGLTIAPNGDVWVSLNNEILQFHSNVVVNRAPSFRPEDKPGALLATRLGEVWCGGCAAFQHADATFSAAPLCPPDWSVAPCCDDSFGNLWAVASDDDRRDLAILNSEHPHTWRLIDLPPEVGDAPWCGVVVDDSGYIWIGTPKALIQVDPRSHTGYRRVPVPDDEVVTAIARVAGRQVVVGCDDGTVLELTMASDRSPSWETIATGSPGPVRALLHDRTGALWTLAGGQISRSDALRASWHQYWDEQPRMPAGNHDHIFARIGDRLYTAGGKTFYGWPADEWVNLDHVWSCSVDDGTWRVEPPMLEPGKAYSGIAALGNELWLLGGYFRDAEARAGTRPTDTVEIYNPDDRHFRPGPHLPRASGQIVALTVADRIYAIGGDGVDRPAPDVYSIGVGEHQWRSQAPAPGPVSQASGCVLNDRIYVAAGPSSECPGLFVYDPSADSWRVVDHPADRAPSAPLCAAFAGKVWVMGGRGDGGGQTATWMYDPETDEWGRGPDIPLPASWAAAAEVDGRLTIAGGAYEDERVGGYFNTDRVFVLRDRACNT